jgi:hypothetical protein
MDVFCALFGAGGWIPPEPLQTVTCPTKRTPNIPLLLTNISQDSDETVTPEFQLSITVRLADLGIRASGPN